MVNGNVPPLRPLRLFPLIAGLLANWYQTTAQIIVMLTGGSISPHASMKSLWHTMLLCGTAKHTESPCHADGRKHLTARHCATTVPSHGTAKPQRKPMSC
jgi:hypothetical protein